MQIKICGLFRPQDVDYVNEALPDYAGFVFWPKSRRFLTKEQAESMRGRLDKSIRSVGVFVDEDPKMICELLHEGILDIAQLHGRETEDDIRFIQNETGKPVWKAAIVRSAEDVAVWQDSLADCLLFDGGMGGGEAFRWEYLSGMNRPFFLAGGMDRERIIEAKNLPGLMGIDISSGVETNGVKDREKILQIVRCVREIKNGKEEKRNGK